MGSSSRRKPSQQPSRILPSGESAGLVGALAEGGGSPIEMAVDDGQSEALVAIPLVQIDAEVHAAAAIGDLVTLIAGKNRIDVLRSGRRLGSIPAHYETWVRSRSISGGRISRLGHDPLEASFFPSAEG